MEILKNTDHAEEINWSLFKIRNKDGIPKPVNSFTFATTESDKFQIISDEYSSEIIEYFHHQEFAKNNVITEHVNTIEIQKKSIESLTTQVNTLREALRSGNLSDLDDFVDNYNFTDDFEDLPDYHFVPL